MRYLFIYMSLVVSFRLINVAFQLTVCDTRRTFLALFHLINSWRYDEIFYLAALEMFIFVAV